MSRKLEHNLNYEVVILRTDGQHISTPMTQDYDKCFEVWEQITNEWTNAAKEQRPFILRDPIITAFAPALIFEVRLLPVTGQETTSKTYNPYSQKMQEQGFSRTFPSQGRDLLG